MWPDSRENVPYGIRSNGWTHSMWTDDKRIEKPFKTSSQATECLIQEWQLLLNMLWV